MTENPWDLLGVPSHASEVSARRVAAGGRWDFYWACDSERRAMLLMHVPSSVSARDRLPKLRGIEVLEQPENAEAGPRLVWRLRDPSLRDIFLRLCVDIMSSADAALTEEEAVAIALTRTWRWHYLMRGGGGDILSAEEQKGLIGELIVLETYFLSHLSAARALSAWRGPLGETRDFALGTVAVESKAHATDASLSVRISSEFQLDDNKLDALYLHLALVDTVNSDDEDSVTLQSVADRIGSLITAKEPSSTARYEALLLAAGMRPENDYSSLRFKVGHRRLYRVLESFPRLVPSSIPVGVERVTYNVSLSLCSSFLVEDGALALAIEGALNEH